MAGTPTHAFSRTLGCRIKSRTPERLVVLPAVDERDYPVEVGLELRVEPRPGLELLEDFEPGIVVFNVAGLADQGWCRCGCS